MFYRTGKNKKTKSFTKPVLLAHKNQYHTLFSILTDLFCISLFIPSEPGLTSSRVHQMAINHQSQFE